MSNPLAGISQLGIGELCSAFALLLYASIAGKTVLIIMLCIMPASWTVLCLGGNQIPDYRGSLFNQNLI